MRAQKIRKLYWFCNILTCKPVTHDKQFWATGSNAAVQKMIMPVSIMVYSIADISVKALQNKVFRLLQFLQHTQPFSKQFLHKPNFVCYTRGLK